MTYKEQPATEHLEIHIGPKKEHTRVARISINFHPEMIPLEVVQVALAEAGFMLGRFFADTLQVSERRQN